VILTEEVCRLKESLRLIQGGRAASLNVDYESGLGDDLDE
jgi:hypothetical protein